MVHQSSKKLGSDCRFIHLSQCSTGVSKVAPTVASVQGSHSTVGKVKKCPFFFIGKSIRVANENSS